MASLSPGLSLSLHGAWDSRDMFEGAYIGGRACTPSANAATQTHRKLSLAMAVSLNG